MSNNNSSGATGGVGVVGLLGVLFVALKLCHVIDWSWVWVLAPFWIAAAAVVGILVFALVLALVSGGRR